MTSHDHVHSRTHSYGDWHFSRLQTLLDRTPDRTCEVCLRRVPRADARKRASYWLCPNCEHDDLHRLIRRRYVERYSDAELRRCARLVIDR
jgi:hypothetical protein